jgi:predicted AAA+ superfamily ATPase
MVVKLTRLTSQNPWWRTPDWEKDDKDLNRIDILFPRRMPDIASKGITIVRGIRRSGKTVFVKLLVKHLITKGLDPKDILYLSGDRQRSGEIKGIVEEFSMRRGNICLLLDEVTYLPDWHLLLKELHETRDVTIVATGSDAIQLKAKSERLPGRGVEGNEYYFDPLSFREFVTTLVKAKSAIDERQLRKALDDIAQIPTVKHLVSSPHVNDIYPYYEPLEKLFYAYLYTGGFPLALSDYIKTGQISELTYESLVRTILGSLAKDGRSEATGRTIMEQLLIGMGGRTDYVTIARNIDAHHTTVKDFIDILDGARILYTFNCWDLRSKGLAPRKQKKFVFQSPLIGAALHRYLTGGTWDDTVDFMDKNMEGLVEATVMSHIVWNQERPLMKEQNSFSGFYYGNKECDCVILSEGEFHGFEVKYGKVERSEFPFPVTYISKDALGPDTVPACLFLYGLEKSKWSL